MRLEPRRRSGSCCRLSQKAAQQLVLDQSDQQLLARGADPLGIVAGCCESIEGFDRRRGQPDVELAAVGQMAAVGQTHEFLCGWIRRHPRTILGHP